MDPHDHQQSSHDSSQSYGWMSHASWNNVSIDQFPTAPGPIIYEGFIPQQTPEPSRYTSVQSFRNTQAYTPFSQSSQYPPLDLNDYGREPVGGPVRPLNRRSPSARLSSVPRSSYPPLPELHVPQTSTDNDETSQDEYENPAISESHAEGLVSNPISGDRGRHRKRGSGRGPGRPRRSERQRGGWNKGTKTGPRAVLDPGEEFNTLHKGATDAFIDEQDYDKAIELILKAISINPEIYSAHVLLSQIYFARNDDERGMAALFSGAHAAPNDPAVWNQLADACLQQTSTDRYTMLKQASYCFQRLLQINQQDHDARFQKAAISRELGHHAKALKDLEYLLQKMPHNSSILRQMAELCLDINDVGKAIGLYDDAIEFHRLNETMEEDYFAWADLLIYVDLVARLNGSIKAIQKLKSIARSLLGREQETYWEELTDDDREWDVADIPRRVATPEFQSGYFPLDAYGTGLPLELRVKLGDLRLQHGDREEALGHFEWLLPNNREEDAPLYKYTDLFLQVADALGEVKEYEQALLYYEALNSVNACDDIDFWLGFGACSYVCEKRDQAIFCYEEAKIADPASGEARTQLSKLYAAKGDRDKALLLARSAITIYETQLPRTEKRKYERKDLREAREAAQKAYKDAYKIPRPGYEHEDLPQPHFSRRAREKARRLARQAAENDAAGEGDDEYRPEEHREGSLEPPRRQGWLSSREIVAKQMRKRKSKKEKSAQDRYETIRQLYSTMCGVTDAMREGDDVARNIWMDCAEAMVDEFRSERAFYPPERYMKFQGFDLPFKRHIPGTNAEGVADTMSDSILPSIESNIPNDYCGIIFSNWLDIFLEYAIQLANLQEDGTECYAVISAALDCNVWYHDPDAVIHIYTCWLTCALALRDEVTLFNTVIRWFMREFVFCTDTYRLFSALNYYFPYPSDKAGKSGQMNNAVFRMGPNQKYLLRQIVAIDRTLPEDYGSDQPDGPVPNFMRKGYREKELVYMSNQTFEEESRSQAQQAAATANIDEDDDDIPSLLSRPGEDDAPDQRTFTPQELDIVLLTLYAQVLYAGGSFPNALSYFYRAYTLEPKNPIVLLSIALCYLHQMLKRQNENRHMYVLQGWSFFEEYAEARTEWAQEQEKAGHVGLLLVVKREIEFNRGRCWQMLGMSDLAVQCFGRMLDMQAVKVEDEMDIDRNTENKEVFSMEAAYTMASVYAINGDIGTARALTEKYLVVE